jgi:dienelactone hydrolase
MIERVVRFGTDDGLVGILTEPSPGRAVAGTGIIFVNAGLLHRIGPHRVHVAAARRVAGDGFHALRFDLSGIGESEPRRDTTPYPASAVADIRDAMSFLETTEDLHRFVLVGLCSGADNSLRTALADARVAGAVLIDGFCYRTVGYYLHHYAPRLLRPRSWLGLFRRIRRRGGPTGTGPPAPDAATRTMLDRGFPPRDQLRSDLRTLRARGVRLHFIFTGGLSHLYNHEAQFRRSMRGVPLEPVFDVTYWPEAAHTFTSTAQRSRFLEALPEWLAPRFRNPNLPMAPDAAAARQAPPRGASTSAA